MKTILVLGLILPFFANAKPLEAEVNCSCAAWIKDKNGEMSLKTAHTGMSVFPILSDELSGRLLKNRFYQEAEGKEGYATVTPGFLKLLAKTPFIQGDEVLKNASESCKQMAASDEGFTNCAVSITFPINENAKKLAQ